MPLNLTPVGSTFNTDYATADPDILIVTPKDKMRDDAQAARLNMDFQTQFAQGVGQRCAVVVVMTNLLSQDAATRKVYAEGMTPERFFAVALVVTSSLSRAMASFFMGLSRPPIPTKIFDSVENAVAWVRSVRPA